MKVSFALILFLAPFLSSAHEGTRARPATISEVSATAINELYSKDVKPIFQKKCFDCHSQKTNYPWYHKIPGVKQLIESDIKEGLEHIDFEPGFPFKSHATPSEDLDEILEVIEKNDMPPMSYRIMHPSSKLTEPEKEIIKKWVQAAKETLAKESKTETK